MKEEDARTGDEIVGGRDEGTLIEQSPNQKERSLGERNEDEERKGAKARCERFPEDIKEGESGGRRDRKYKRQTHEVRSF